MVAFTNKVQTSKYVQLFIKARPLLSFGCFLVHTLEVVHIRITTRRRIKLSHQSLKMRATMHWINDALNLKRHGHPELNFLPVVKLHRIGKPGVMEDFGQPVEDSEESGKESMESSEDSEESSEDSEESAEDYSEGSSEDSSEESSEEPWQDSYEPWEVFVEPGEFGVEPGEVSVSEYLISKNLNNAQTEWSDPPMKDHSYSITTTAPATEQPLSVADVLLRDDADCLLYTGIPLQEFHTLVSWFHVSAPTLSTIPVVDQILLTLMKLRQNFVVDDLARRFTWSPGQVSETLNFWIDAIAEKTMELIPWLPNTTCIIDCTESALQKPKHLYARTESYCHYYANNNVKYLVATATSGIIMFISKAYGGKCSDRLIAQNSGILDHLRAGDVVMGHPGSTIGDLLEERSVHLVLPARAKNEVTHTQHIANVRNPGERAINRLKVYKILSQTVPIHLVPKIDNILQICAALVNLRGELISTNMQTI